MPTLLSVVQDFCGRQNLPTPTTVYGSSDPQIIQIMRLLEEEGTDLAARGPWQALTFDATLTTIANENQGLMKDIATNGFNYIKNQTIWDRTNRLPVLGPVSGPEWQAMKAYLINGPRFRFRIRGSALLVNPVPAAGYDWHFEYISSNWLVDAAGTTYKSRFTADTDEMFQPNLCLQGLRWRWKKEKGFDYAEDFRTYESQLKDALGRDGGKDTLVMDSDRRGIIPGIWVSPGNWI